MCFFVLLDRSFEDPRQLQAADRRRRGPRRLQAAGRPLERKRTPVRLFLVQNSFSSLILILSMIFRNSQQ